MDFGDFSHAIRRFFQRAPVKVPAKQEMPACTGRDLSGLEEIQQPQQVTVRNGRHENYIARLQDDLAEKVPGIPAESRRHALGIAFGLSVGLALQARRSRHGPQEPRVLSQLKENSLYVSLESRRPGDKAQKLP